MDVQHVKNRSEPVLANDHPYPHSVPRRCRTLGLIVTDVKVPPDPVAGIL